MSHSQILKSKIDYPIVQGGQTPVLTKFLNFHFPKFIRELEPSIDPIALTAIFLSRS